MIYCQGYTVSFQEVPDEVSLVLSIGDCPHRCKGCHSPELQRPVGDNLSDKLSDILDEYGDAITCVCFMGEGRDEIALKECAEYCRNRGYNTALYAGSARAWAIYASYFDYIKSGQYVEALGGLDSPTTNQFMLRVIRDEEEFRFEDITYKFRKRSE